MSRAVPTIVVELVLAVPPCGAVHGLGHGLGRHHPEQPVEHGVVLINSLVQGVGQCFIGPARTQFIW